MKGKCFCRWNGLLLQTPTWTSTGANLQKAGQWPWWRCPSEFTWPPEEGALGRTQEARRATHVLRRLLDGRCPAYCGHHDKMSPEEGSLENTTWLNKWGAMRAPAPNKNAEEHVSETDDGNFD